MGLDNVRALPFIQRMDWAYGLANLVVSRAGAGTISELALLGKAALLVPSPNVSEDHQTKNAMALVIKEAAVLVKDAEAPQVLLDKALELLADDQRCRRLSGNILQLARPDADKDIAQEVLKLGNF
jgi:UDP-N-acetylglucosamine--N-acetylmuramyl-(pentapeptide) pyrophosphoryl-undecaprenol N-acetylglucosamine transferase